MALLTKIQTISTEVMESFESEHPNYRVVFAPSENHLEMIREALDDDSLPAFLLTSIKSYFWFPYLEDDSYSLEAQYVERMCRVYAIIGKSNNQVLTNFIVEQVQETLDLIKSGGIENIGLSRGEVSNRIDQTYEDFDSVKHSAEEFEDDSDPGLAVLILNLKTVDATDSGKAARIEMHPDDKYAKDKFLKIMELGLIDCLENNWEWIQHSDSGKDGSNLMSNQKRFAALVSHIFGFPNPETIRTYLKEWRSSRESFYKKGKREFILDAIRGLGLKRTSQEKKS